MTVQPDPMPGSAVPVEIAGTSRRLRFTNRAQFKLREVAGAALPELLLRGGTLDGQALTHLVWAGRLHAEPDLEVDTVVDELDPADYPKYIAAIMAAVHEAMPWMAEEEAAANGSKKKKRAGSTRGRPRARST